MLVPTCGFEKAECCGQVVMVRDGEAVGDGAASVRRDRGRAHARARKRERNTETETGTGTETVRCFGWAAGVPDFYVQMNLINKAV